MSDSTSGGIDYGSPTRDNKEAAVSFIEEDEEDADNVTEASYDDEAGDDEMSQPSNASESSLRMPLFHYRRVSEALPRARVTSTGAGSATAAIYLTKDCTATAMGRLVLNADTTPAEEAQVSSPSASFGGAGPHGQPPPSASASASQLTRSWFNTELSLIAYGFETGDLVVADAVSTLSVGNVLSRPLSSQVVALCWDSLGTNLGILTQDRVVTVCADLKYSIQMRSVAQEPQPDPVISGSVPRDGPVSPPPSAQTQASRPNAFSSFMSALTGRSPVNPDAAPSQSQVVLPASASPVRNSEDQVPPNQPSNPAMAPALTAVTSQMQIHRITYPESFGRPTCFAIDPAYKRRQNVVVGFADGKLVYTRRGFFRQRQDTIVYQGTAQEIQAVAWRGTILAFADASGIRLVDLDNMARIAHVDRPTGARPSLYPTVTDLLPVMTWETSSTLLVAWGDCLLSLQVRDAAPANHARNRSEISRASSGGQSPPPVPDAHDDEIVRSPSIDAQSTTPASPSGVPPTRRRTVECTMAWQLDCLACGVAPLDRDRVVVLGLVPPSIDGDGEEDFGGRGGELHNGAARTKNEVELQVISRINGEVAYADQIPVHRRDQESESITFKDIASSFRLGSSFAVPRMEDAIEVVVLDELHGEIEGGTGTDTAEPSNPLSLFSMDASSRRLGFKDSHLRWNLEMVSYEGEKSGATHEAREYVESDTDSVDSDDYGMIFRSPTSRGEESESPLDKLAVPPTMLIAASNDVIQVRVRGIDDAISFALAKKRAGLALFWGLSKRRQIRRYGIRDLVNSWFRAVLRQAPAEDDDSAGESQQEEMRKGPRSSPHLSLRRMKLAAEAMPILLGGDVSLWCRWIKEMEKIPGALFIARYSIPVRDPILPKEIYAGVLGNMLEQIANMSQSTEEKVTVERLVLEAEGHFLNTLLSWGSIPILQEFLKLHTVQSTRDKTFAVSARVLEESLARRRLQSSSCYLQFRSDSTEGADEPESGNDPSSTVQVDEESLFQVDDVLQIVSKRLNNAFPTPQTLAKAGKTAAETNRTTDRVCLEAAAALEMMKGNFDEALRHFLWIGLHEPIKDLETIENDAVHAVNTSGHDDAPTSRSTSRKEMAFRYVLNMIEIHHLHQCLLNDRFLSSADEFPPLFALVRLVGLNALGDFLIEHCVPPQHTRDGSERSSVKSGTSTSTTEERRGTLPLDLVAQQLEGSPKLLHWYLHVVFTRKPNAYVQFSSTSNPPPILNRLHRKHLDLYVKFADSHRDSSVVFSGVDAYRVPDKTTPLLSFLKVVLQLGGIQPMEIAKLLQAERSKGNNVAVLMRSFALELAYILENFGDDGADESKLILELYLQGCRSLMLAVSYAQRTPSRSEQLWKSLIDYCLSDKQSQQPPVAQAPDLGGSKSQTKSGRINGSLFGSLLEAAALSGADLAHLVQQIPPGMAVEGLRPRLVSAVADSRFKVQMQEMARDIASAERMSLVRELEHRSRRGIRYCRPAASAPEPSSRARPASPEGLEAEDFDRGRAVATTVSGTLETRIRRAVPRQDRYRLSLTIPIR